MSYATYEYYLNTYNGEEITEDRWQSASCTADEFIDAVTFGRLGAENAVSDEVKRASCAVAEVADAWDRIENGIVYSDPDDFRWWFKSAAVKESCKNADMLEAVTSYLPRSHPLRRRDIQGATITEVNICS